MILLSFVAFASAANPRPQLPHCECLATWPHSDNITTWQYKSWGVGNAPGANYKFTEGPAAGTYGQAIPADNGTGGPLGCFDAGLSWGDGTPANAFKICVPDTTNGPCIAYGDYDGWIQSFYMTCGIGETGNGSTDANPVLEGEALRAAAAFEAAVTELVESPVCECADDWSATDISRRFCGGNAPMAVAEGVNSTMCNAPANFNNAIDENNNGSVKEWVTGSDKWCALKTPACSADNTHIEPCSGQKWIKLPIVASKQSALAHGMVQALKQRSASISPPLRTAYMGFTAMTFHPEIVTGLYMNEDFGAWRIAMADITAVYSQYDKPDATAAPLTQVQLDTKKMAAEVKANLTAEKKSMCEANPECKTKADAQECGALAAAAVTAFGAAPTASPTPAPSSPGVASPTPAPSSPGVASSGPGVASSALSKMPSIGAFGGSLFAVVQMMKTQ